jgi:Protein of unknown function (DUF1353)
MPFLQKTLDVRTGDGLDDTLLEPLFYERDDGTMLRAPIYGTTDGLSVPRCVQNIIPATGGDWFSGVLHDSAYRGQLEVLQGVEWVKANYTQAEADGLILEAMTSQGIGWLKRQTIYRALRLFGSFAYKEDHQ